ncbi:obg-like ATPase 1 isoform X1 [Gallus gallus]|uniref:obg-like ATPase 1 isoform X1 n=1 Tax=Gallus gallus TaxID=9031 RepID=UPI001F0053EF|nr:obg-like ATPase 1 isoform X1 [Gallus gallus]
MPVHGFGKVIACGVEFVKPQSCRNVLSLRRTIRRRATGVPRAALQAAVGAAGRGAGRGSSVSWEQPGLSAQGSRPAPPASRRRPFPSRGPGQWAKRPRLFRRRLLLGRRVRLRVPGLPLRSGGPQPPPRPVPRDGPEEGRRRGEGAPDYRQVRDVPEDRDRRAAQRGVGARLPLPAGRAVRVSSPGRLLVRRRGKSTFFNVLTKSQAAAENFPFCTIDPNESRVPVPDDRFDFLCQYHKPPSKIPAFLNVVDIAGLVKGAHTGQGLGNSFLSHINACDGIFHLMRAFEDDDITHVEGSVDPVRDIEIIHEELRLKDEELITQSIDKLEKVAVRGGDKKLKPEYDVMCKIKTWVIDEKKAVRFYHDWNDKEIDVLNKHLFFTSKPMIYLVNLSEKDYIRKKNKWLIKIKEWVDKHDPGALVIPFSGALELKLQDMSAEEKQKYLEENMTQSALPKIIKAGYAALQLEYFFTAGPDEVRAWTIRKGTKAPQAAGKIHTDFEKGFIMAEVMKYEDFKEGGSEAAVKAAGKYRQQGRNYIVEDGDIIFFKFNTPQQPKKK